jgi:filamentous hemagglutinin
MFQRLNLDPDKQLRRMGDDFYEQRLVMEQITGLTGRRYLDADQGDGMGQYRAMMDAGVTEAARQQLSVGVALSAEQVAALNEDIVWMVAQEVDGQKVLVPVVYRPRPPPTACSWGRRHRWRVGGDPRRQCVQPGHDPRR